MGDESLRMQAEVVDKATGPLRKISDQLKKFGDQPQLKSLRGELDGLQKTLSGLSNFSGLGGALSSIGIGAGGAAASLAALATSMKDFANRTAEMRHLSRETGIAINTLEALGRLGQRHQIPIDSMTASIGSFADKMHEVSKRRGEFYAVLTQKAPGLAETLVGDKTTFERLDHVLDFLSKIKDPIQQKSWAAAFGLNSRLFSDGAVKLREQWQEISAAMSRARDDGGAAAARYAEAVSKFDDSIEDLKHQLADSGFIDGMTKVVTAFKDMLESNGMLSFRSTITDLKNIFAIIGKVGDGFSWLGQSLGLGGGGGAGGISPAVREQGYKKLGEAMRGGVADPGAGTGLTRGDRNNNPGNLKFGEFARAHGATGADDKGHAIFPDAATGKAAMSALLTKYQEKDGLTTTRQIVSKWAPSSDGNRPGQYSGIVSKHTGVGPDDPIDLSDPAMREKFMQGMMQAEGTGRGGSPRANFMKGQFGGVGENLTRVQTPFGSITVNKASAGAFQRFYDGLAEDGAPIKRLGSFNPRRQRWSSRISQHAYGNATDIDDNQFFSPAMRAWFEKNRDKFQKRLQENGMIWGGTFPKYDPGHVEWGGAAVYDPSNPVARAGRRSMAPQEHRVRGDASLRIDVNGLPRGAHMSFGNDGDLFRTVSLNRGTSMTLPDNEA